MRLPAGHEAQHSRTDVAAVAPVAVAAVLERESVASCHVRGCTVNMGGIYGLLTAACCDGGADPED